MRRYPRSVDNLLNHYAPLCSETVCVDNSVMPSVVVFTQNAQGRIILNQQLYQQLCQDKQ
jgi:predicted ABC-type ATPase